MDYIKIAITVAEEDKQDILIAALGGAGFEGFEQTEEELLAYIDCNSFDEAILKEVLVQYNVAYKKDTVQQENWNEKWESSFEPVVVDDFCIIRADFHKPNINVVHDIVITPKMSFGTGHHATTQLMVKYMKDIDFKEKSVLDFGTGTGVLAILAEKMGADSIMAIDNDEWSYHNTIENIERNVVNNISVKHATLDSVYGHSYNVILANINRNILTQYMTEMYSMLHDGGVLLLSGIMLKDKEILESSVANAGFNEQQSQVQGDWVAILAQK